MRSSRTMLPRLTDADLLELGSKEQREAILLLRDELIYLRRDILTLKGGKRDTLPRMGSVPSLPEEDQ